MKLNEALRLADALMFESIVHQLEVINNNARNFPEDHSHLAGDAALEYLIYAERCLRKFDLDYPTRNRELHSIFLSNLTELDALFSTYQDRWLSATSGWVSLPYGANDFALPRSDQGDGIFVFYDGALDHVYDNRNMPNVLLRAATYAHETRKRLYFACHRLTQSAFASCVTWHTRQGLEIIPIFMEGTSLNRPANKYIHQILGSSEIDSRISEMCGHVECAEIAGSRIKLYRGRQGN